MDAKLEFPLVYCVLPGWRWPQSLDSSDPRLGSAISAINNTQCVQKYVYCYDDDDDDRHIYSEVIKAPRRRVRQLFRNVHQEPVEECCTFWPLGLVSGFFLCPPTAHSHDKHGKSSPTFTVQSSEALAMTLSLWGDHWMSNTGPVWPQTDGQDWSILPLCGHKNWKCDLLTAD